jgi:hypothetical protein
LTENLEITGRLLRGRIPPQAGYEDALLRSRRVRAVGTVALASSVPADVAEGEEGAEEEKDDADESKLRWFEKGAFLAPWDTKAREQLEVVRGAVEGRS